MGMTGDSEMIARLEERVKEMQDDVKEIKKSCNYKTGCIGTQLDTINKQLIEIQTNLTNHLHHHELHDKWIQWLPSVAAVFVASASFWWSVVR